VSVTDPSFGIAFLAGLISFVSPCVLPLVPAYISYMGGRVTNTVAAQVTTGAVVARPTLGSRFSTVLHGLAFVGGFTFIFVALGLLSTAFIRQIGGQNLSLVTNIIGRAGGVVIIFFGLHFTGLAPALVRWLQEKPERLNNPLITLVIGLLGSLLFFWAFVDPLIGLPIVVVFVLWLVLGGGLTHPAEFWLKVIERLENAFYGDTRRQMVASGQQSYASSAVMGMIFVAGWTPCIGPVYGAVLTMAANGGEVSHAGVLLMAYSLGLGIPFLLTSLLLDSAQAVLRRLRPHMRKIELFSGVFLIVMGIAIASGQLQTISQQFAGQFADFSTRVETCVLDWVQGERPLNDVGPCINNPKN
jgi:cytochrome c-type biogenesis protein